MPWRKKPRFDKRIPQMTREQDTPRNIPFGVRLRRLREAAGLTQEELAAKAGLTAKAVSALERGERRRPYPHTVRSLADALGLAEGERLALQAAREASGLFPDGVVFVALASLGDPALVLPTIAQSLGMREAEYRKP